LDRTKDRRFRYGIPIGDASVTVSWTREENRIVDDLILLLDPPPTSESAASRADALGEALAPAALDDTPFYALTLSGNAARVVVRAFVTTTVGEVKRNVRAFFDALRIAPEDEGPPSLWRLERSVEAPSTHGLSPELGAMLLRVALLGGPLPREI